jgi:hypothetical protein
MQVGTGSWRAWSVVLAVCQSIAAGVGVLGVLGGIVLVVSDESSDTDEFDGLLTGVGIILGGAGLLLALAFVGLLLWTVSGRRRARDGDPSRLRAAAATNLVVGSVPLVLALVLTPRSGGGGWPPWVAADLLGLALVVAGALVLRSLRGRAPALTDR